MLNLTRMINFGRSFLFWYPHDMINFRISELQAITSLYNIKYEWLEPPSNDPYLLVNLSSVSDLEKIMSRTVLIRSAYELWAHEVTHKDLHHELGKIPKKFSAQYCDSNASFKVDVETFGKKITPQLKVKRIDELAFMDFKGPVKLANPDNTFLLMEYYGLERNIVPENPCRLFFGRWMKNGQRNVCSKISLKTRRFIGHTSMDPLLSLIMANLAKVEPGSLVLDPFVGSGSLLVAAAYFGGYVCGTDIDYLLLHGKAKPSRCNQKTREPDENVKANFKQYKLESKYVDVVISDASLPLWRCPSLFDAIITDPPYGIREAAEKIGTEKNYKIPDHLAALHIPSKVSYTLQHIIEDLIEFSSLHLKVNGRLVFWMPAYKADFDVTNLPQHPCFKIMSCSEQVLTNHSSRYLITMEKTKERIGQECKATVSQIASTFRDKYFQARQKKILEN